jgi:hypothetical protein
MNSRAQFIADVHATLLVLKENKDTLAPESSFYLAFGSDMERFIAVKTKLISEGLITCKSNVFKITEKGEKLCDVIQNMIDEAKQKAVKELNPKNSK